MQTNYEKAFELIKTLPPSDLQKIKKWIQANQNKPNGEPRNEKVEEKVRKFNSAMKWIDEHREEYLGQWVCLDGDKLISFGTDAIKVDEDARASGIKSPFVVQILEEPKHYGGGIEMCR